MWIFGLFATIAVVWALAYWGAGTGLWIAAFAGGLAVSWGLSSLIFGGL